MTIRGWLVRCTKCILLYSGAGPFLGLSWHSPAFYVIDVCAYWSPIDAGNTREDHPATRTLGPEEPSRAVVNCQYDKDRSAPWEEQIIPADSYCKVKSILRLG